MQKGYYLTTILRSPKTVFTYEDLALLWGEPASSNVRVRLDHYVRRGNLFHIRRGLFAKDKNYNKLELATRIFTPSYVSFETILAQEGVIFQFYRPIFIASYLTREVTVNGQLYSYRKIRNTILMDSTGVEHRDESSFASKERALLDTLYLNTDYHFDNPGGINWDKVLDILPVYANKRMAKTVDKLYKQHIENKP